MPFTGSFLPASQSQWLELQNRAQRILQADMSRMPQLMNVIVERLVVALQLQQHWMQLNDAQKNDATMKLNQLDAGLKELLSLS